MSLITSSVGWPNKKLGILTCLIFNLILLVIWIATPSCLLVPEITTTKRCVANVEVIFQKGKKGNSGRYSPVCFTAVPGKHMAQVLLLTISGPVKKKKWLGLASLVWPRVRVADVTYLDYSRTFFTVSHSILVSEFWHYNQDDTRWERGRWTTKWNETGWVIRLKE